MVGIIIAVIVVLLILYIISVYNTLVSYKARVQNAWSQIEVQLQRRFDLIPNLVECVKGYMGHESQVLEKVTALRSSWANAKTITEKAELGEELSSTLKTIMAVSESYPDLKANENFLDIQDELKNTEDKISYARQFYNDTVTKYNTKIALFPTVIIASLFKFSAEPLFKTESEEARHNVKIDFGTNENK